MAMGRTPTVNNNLPKGVRARKRGDVIYYFYDTGSKPRKEISLGKNYIEAIKKWAELEGRNQTPCFYFVDLAERYIKEVVPTKAPRTQRDNIDEMSNLITFFNNPPAPLVEIKQIHVRQYMNWRTKNGTEATVRANREKALLSHVFNTAIEWGIFEGVNPCTGIKRYSETSRNIYVEDEVFDAVYSVSSQPLKDAIDLAYLTGQRPADVIAMSSLDIADGFIKVQQNKTNTRLRIAIEGSLKDLLDRIKQRKKPHSVYSLNLICTETGRPLTQKALAERFKRARKLAISKYPKMAEEIKNYQFRDLRAKAATDKAESSDIRQAQVQLGHSSVTMTETYVRNRKGQKVTPTK